MMINPALHPSQEIETITYDNQFDRDIEMINNYAGITPISVPPELYAFLIQCYKQREHIGKNQDTFDTTSHDTDHQIEFNPLLLSIYLPFRKTKISLGNANQLDIN